MMNRFESVSALEEWVSTVQFTYVGGGQAAKAQVYELSNKTEEEERRKRSIEFQEQQQQQQTAGTPSASQPPAPTGPVTLAEQLVECLVRILQTGMRTGLRGALEVIKILDRLPDQIFVPYPASSFNNNLLAQASAWFRTAEELESTLDASSANGSSHTKTVGNRNNSGLVFGDSFEVATLPVKFVKSTLFVVNTAACDENASVPCCNPGAQVRMFLRICLQQRCLLAVFELIIGFLKANEGSLADFLYVHSSATPLLHDYAFPQLLDCLRKIGGPPLVVRAVAQSSGISIAPLLESPWDPVQCGATDQPVIASWSMWFAQRGLRLKWALDYNVRNDAKQPDYVPEPAVTAEQQLMKGLLGSAGGGGGGGPSMMLSDRGGGSGGVNFSELGDVDDKGSVAGSTTRVVRRIVKTKRSARVDPNAAAVMDRERGEFSGDGFDQQQQPSSNQAVTPTTATPNTNSRRPRAQTTIITTTTTTMAGRVAGESPRPSTTTTTATGVTTPGRNITATATNLFGGGGSNTNSAQDGARSAGRRQSSKSPPPQGMFVTPPGSSRSGLPQQQQLPNQQQQQSVSLQEMRAKEQQRKLDSTVREIQEKTQRDVAFVDNTIARWKREAEEFQQTTLADSVQPLLESYAALVYAKWSSALSQSALSECKLMEANDVDATSGVRENNELVTPRR